MFSSLQERLTCFIWLKGKWLMLNMEWIILITYLVSEPIKIISKFTQNWKFFHTIAMFSLLNIQWVACLYNAYYQNHNLFPKKISLEKCVWINLQKWFILEANKIMSLARIENGRKLHPVSKFRNGCMKRAKKSNILLLLCLQWF